MANTISDRENAGLHPLSLKMRDRLQSAPGKLLKSPSKVLSTPLPSGRKAFGAVNKKTSTPAANTQEKKLLKPQETKVKCVPQAKVEEYPEIENCIPYDPLEFEKYSMPEDFIPFASLALPGLGCLPHASHLCEEDWEKIEPLPDPSPVKKPDHSDYCPELDAFLQTLDELTIELPPEPADD
ncbi:securin isoform 2-T2 [Pholidichthys leucotaenia]